MVGTLSAAVGAGAAFEVSIGVVLTVRGVLTGGGWRVGWCGETASMWGIRSHSWRWCGF